MSEKTENRQIIPKRLFRVQEAAEYLGLAPRTIYNGIAPKSKQPFPVRFKKLGKVILFEKRDLDEYVDSLPYADN
ncbi:MAG: helix-turn-helix domain-containing protein [Deltaproteobacteria bacterium]|nr:helix-turn-helix domain-containing protein [Deltaproteobacteria bacterium]MBW2105770.1 helix-turn-helix domain-containing protein [Deltaproteobacteria bacterium]